MKTAVCLVFLAAWPSAAEPPVTDVAFAPHGDSVVATSQSGLHVFRWPELKRERTIRVSAANLHCVVFSPNGERVAVGGGNPSEDGSVEVFSWPEGTSLARLEGHADSVRSIVWRDDARLFSASIDRTIKLWDIDSKTAVRTFKGHSRSVDAICRLPDEMTLVSSGVDQSVRVWNVDSGELIRSLNQHTAPVHALAVRVPDGGLPMVASASGDRTIRFWQPTIGRMVRYVRLDAEPLNIAWLGEGSRIVASCVDGHVRVVDGDEVEVTQTLPGIDGWAYALAIHPSDGSIVIGGSNGQLRRIILGSADASRAPGGGSRTKP